MHYYIDGYNMLFRLMHAEEDLQSQRERMIAELNRKLMLVKMDVSLVFDATFQTGERSRHHSRSLEILFTAAGETADEFILEELRNSLHPQQETIVSSDKKLAWQARRRLAHTESVEAFLLRLDKAYKNKQRQLKKQKEVASSTVPSPISKKVEKKQDALSPPSTKATIEECAAYYEQTFEAHFQEISTQEENRRKALKQSKASSRPAARKSSKKKKSRFADAPPIISNATNEMERWLDAFEKRLNLNLDN